VGTVTGGASPLRLAIVGGGFTGVALATHALTSATQPLSVDVIEPSAKLGRGAAYGTTNADHRINVPSDRMSLFSSDPTHFTRWLFDNKWLPDPEAPILLDAVLSRGTRSRLTLRMFSHKQREGQRRPRCATAKRASSDWSVRTMGSASRSRMEPFFTSIGSRFALATCRVLRVPSEKAPHAIPDLSRTRGRWTRWRQYVDRIAS
jgi:hypothetical protein